MGGVLKKMGISCGFLKCPITFLYTE